jgi:hypothetical protein
VEIGGEVHAANAPFVRHGDDLIVGVGSEQLARWDGSAWTWMDRPGLFQLWSGGGELYGSFPWVRWTGTSWAEVPAPQGSIYAVGVLDDGSLLVSGLGLQTFHLDRFDGAAWQPVTGSLDGPVRGIGSYRGALVVGGEFTTIGGDPFRGIAALVPDWIP